MKFQVFCSLDPFGKTDEREPLTNAVRSDSAVIGGKPFFVVESRTDKNDPLLVRKLSEAILNYSNPKPRIPYYLQDCEPFQ